MLKSYERILRLKKIEIRTQSKNYKVIVGKNSIKKFASELKKSERKKLFICDKNVYQLHKYQIDELIKQSNTSFIYFFYSTEKNKTLVSVQKIYDILLKNNFSRQDSLVAIGGGIVGDVTGFAAATFMRGINYYQMPTTLLSMIDSAVGGKTGVNYSKYKNLIGSFYQPQKVCVDTTFLSTLPKKEIYSGIGEIFKYAFLADEENYFFIRDGIKTILYQNQFDEELIAKCIRLKSSVVENDELEKSGLRKILNLGHTFAHAFESTLNFKVKHGEAVIAGIIASLIVSEKIGLISKIDLNKYVTDFYFLPLNKKILIADKSEVIKFMKSDKKSSEGKIKLVLASKPGEIFIDFQVSEKIIRYALSKLFEIIGMV